MNVRKLFLTLLAAFLLSAGLPLAAQSSSGGTSASETEVTQAQSPAESLLDKPIDFSTAASENPQQKQPSSFWIFFRMILALAIVAGAVYAIFRFFKGNVEAQNKADPFLRNVSHITLSPGKSIYIVTLLDKAYILGVTDSSISQIGEVTDKELIQSMNLYADKNSNVKKPRSFADILDIFMPGGPRSEGEGESSNAFSASSVSSLLRRQREQFDRDLSQNPQPSESEGSQL